MKKQNYCLSDIPRLSDKVIIVTGGNSGLGYESAKFFAKQGAEVIISSRTLEKGENAVAKIIKEFPESKLKLMKLDLMDLNSVKSFAENFKKSYSKLDILMNNAGIMMTPYKLSKQGYESQMATNHLGHFALTAYLKDLLFKTEKSRIVNVSSLAHKQGRVSFDDLFYQNQSNYSKHKAYGRSKLANLLFTYELKRRLESKNISCIAVAAHPGASLTNLGNHLVSKAMFKLAYPIAKLLTQSAYNGALPQIMASVHPVVNSGDYFGPSGFMELAGKPIKVKSIKLSHNKEIAERFWLESEKAIGLDFKI